MSTPTVDINRVKLGRLKEHFDDDGASTPEAVARVIKGKPENVQFLRAYVEAAASEMGTPEILVQFDAWSTNPPSPSAADAEELLVAGISATKVSTPPEDPSTVIESVPEAEVPAPQPVALGRPLSEWSKEIQENGVAAVEAAYSGKPLEYRFKDENGLSHVLVEVHRKGNVVVLGNKPTDEMVTIQLNGAPVEVSLTHLRTLPAGNDFNLNGRNYTVATLLVIADAAKA